MYIDKIGTLRIREELDDMFGNTKDKTTETADE
jgi:hypothetical protein